MLTPEDALREVLARIPEPTGLERVPLAEAAGRSLAEAALYLATAPKSNRTYEAWAAARDRARETPSAPVPLHIRNAPTDLMKGLGYGAGYKYDPAERDGIADQEYLPEALRGERYYLPGEFGFEKTIAERLEWWAERRRQADMDDGRSP